MSASKRERGRPTIGLLTYGIRGTVAVDMWLGVSDATRARGANALCFPGGLLGEDTLWASAEANVLYELAGAENVDGLVIWSGAIIYPLDLEAARAFCTRYHALPMVSVALPLPGVANLVADNYQPVRQAVAHLIEVHGRRRIGFLRGPESHPEANERYRAYVDALSEHGITLDSNLVTPGSYGYDKPAGTAAAGLLLEERMLRPGVDFDALVAANDEMALGMLESLQGRGIRVPDEVAITGFNDQEEASAVTPPLTTVRYSFYELGQRAAASTQRWYTPR
jgi:DNA-binding LacI/PurR family transcriptional regulator